jgi:hypothetical protein
MRGEERARVTGAKVCTRHTRLGEWGKRVGAKNGVRGGGNNARRRRSVSRICVSTSLMPTPGPPLREREGMMRRGRAAAAWVAPPVFEPEAEAAEGGADAEGPACEAAGSVLDLWEGPPPPPPPLLLLLVGPAIVAAWPPAVPVGVVEFAGAVAVDAATIAGSADDADARLGMLPRRRRRDVFFFFGGGVSGEKSGVLGRG